MKVSRAIRNSVAVTARELHARGWVANHDGNVSARDGNLFAASPTATSKRLITEANVVEIDASGSVVGAGKIFGEIGLHLTVYQRRPDVHCVLHAHPPFATAIASSGHNLIEMPFIAEAVVSLGANIPCTPFAAPGDAAKAALAPWCELVDAVLLGNHGVLTWGADAEQALMRMELVEHLAKIAVTAAPLGGVQALPAASITALLTARSKAGLGRAADKALSHADMLRPSKSSTVLADGAPIAACAPAPHSPVKLTVIGASKRQQSLAEIIREEIVAALK
jgi:L-fuculose-phosphate aldolase